MGKDRQNNNNNSNENGEVMLSFSLSVEDGWPPVGTEDIRYEKVGTDYRVLAPPLFLKGLSVDDVISVKLKNQSVASWTHLSRSGRTTIWLGRKKDHNVIQTTLAKLRELGCDTPDTRHRMLRGGCACISADQHGRFFIRCTGFGRGCRGISVLSSFCVSAGINQRHFRRFRSRQWLRPARRDTLRRRRPVPVPAVNVRLFSPPGWIYRNGPPPAPSAGTGLQSDDECLASSLTDSMTR